MLEYNVLPWRIDIWFFNQHYGLVIEQLQKRERKQTYQQISFKTYVHRKISTLLCFWSQHVKTEFLTYFCDLLQNRLEWSEAI